MWSAILTPIQAKKHCQPCYKMVQYSIKKVEKTHIPFSVPVVDRTDEQALKGTRV